MFNCQNRYTSSGLEQENLKQILFLSGENDLKALIRHKTVTMATIMIGVKHWKIMTLWNPFDIFLCKTEPQRQRLIITCLFGNKIIRDFVSPWNKRREVPTNVFPELVSRDGSLCNAIYKEQLSYSWQLFLSFWSLSSSLLRWAAHCIGFVQKLLSKERNEIIPDGAIFNIILG